MVEYMGRMAVFTPPTYDGEMPIEKNHNGLSLWRHYDIHKVGYNVLITSGEATASPGLAGVSTDDINAADSGSGENGKAWFRGGIAYTITAGEETILNTAGYGAYIV